MADGAPDTRLGCVPRGAGAADGRPVTAVGQAGVWGLGLVAALEHARSWGGLVDLDEPSEGSVDALVDAVAGGAAGGAEDQVAVRDGRVLARRLVRMSGGAAAEAWRPGGTVLVTGATGGIGRHLARWLAAQGAAHLLLVSRRGPDAPNGAALVAEVEAAGATAELVAADVADRDAVRDLLARVPAEHPLTAVFHAAAVLDDAMLPDITPQRADAVLRVKVGGARHLDELTRDLDLSAFVLFSSFAATVGGPG
ncbi:MAG: SDR family NAD(P)-dependent oxidoreductase, partial [Pseudonocardia sp.]|nr:SDR family NAD(P)-dependent oxidoreductase [Pseudonocardia sp.]